MGIPRSVELPAGFVLPEFRFATLYDDNALDIAFVPKCARVLDSAAFAAEVSRIPKLMEHAAIPFFFREKSIVHMEFIYL